MTQPPITGATEVFTIFGHPVGHALSPLIVNAAFVAAGRDAVQIALSPTPDTLEVALRGIVAAGCRGLTVTIPFKAQIVPMLDALGPSAAATGAVNTVVIAPDGRLTGHNTDVDGVLAALAALPSRTRKRAVLIGAGGAARAALAALVQANFERVTIVNRTVAKADALADAARQGRGGETLGLSTGGLSPADLEQSLDGADLLINTTSVGMFPNGAAAAIPATLHRPDLDVIDAVYRPSSTQLCRDAQAAGASAVSGLDWIVAQAVVALRHWLAIDADNAAMRAALDDFLGRPSNNADKTTD